MGVTVSVNTMSVSHKGSNGTSISFPDVCKTPTPGGPIPIPYPNIAKSSDTAKGSKTVKMDGNAIMLKGSNMRMSTGDEAGSAMGIASNKIKGKAEFIVYSFNVKVDGKNVCRLADPALQNCGGTPNGAGPFHVQVPVIATPRQLKMCEETKEKEPERESKKEKTNWNNSGVVKKHRGPMQTYADDEGLVIYVRQTKKENKDWIEDNHQPKPAGAKKGTTVTGGVTQGTTVTKSNVHKVQEWLDKKAPAGEVRAGYDVTKGNKMYARDANAFIGTVHRGGRPYKGSGKKYKGKWMTGDYDLFDLQEVGGECERPEAAFGAHKRGLNKAMGWNGIQHPPQAWWDFAGDKKKGLEPFNMRSEVAGSLERADNHTPSVEFEVGRKPMDVIDSPLTIVAANTGTIALETVKDVKQALICCGCAEE